MSPVLTIFRKELRSYLMTPYGWVILAFIVALQSVSLSGTLKAFQLAPQKEGILFFILHSPMFWFYFLFIFPLIVEVVYERMLYDKNGKLLQRRI